MPRTARGHRQPNPSLNPNPTNPDPDPNPTAGQLRLARPLRGLRPRHVGRLQVSEPAAQGGVSRILLQVSPGWGGVG